MTNQKTIKADPVRADHLKTLPTKSAQIRYLDSIGLTRGDIVRAFKKDLDIEIRYQHVRNVLITPVKNPVK